MVSHWFCSYLPGKIRFCHMTWYCATNCCTTVSWCVLSLLPLLTLYSVKLTDQHNMGVTLKDNLVATVLVQTLTKFATE